LLIASNFGLIIIYDLINKKIFQEIKILNAYLINVIKWNENIFITINANKKTILLIDANNNKVINSVEVKEIFGHERFIRKVRHPLYGEALISVGNDYKIKLYINKNN
jgi:WD40 repeat protein